MSDSIPVPDRFSVSIRSEADHFIEQWFGEPRQEARALIYRWMSLAWDDGYHRGTLDTTSDLEPADNPFTTNPVAVNRLDVEAYRHIAELDGRVWDKRSGPAWLTDYSPIDDED